MKMNKLFENRAEIQRFAASPNDNLIKDGDLMKDRRSNRKMIERMTDFGRFIRIDGQNRRPMNSEKRGKKADSNETMSVNAGRNHASSAFSPILFSFSIFSVQNLHFFISKIKFRFENSLARKNSFLETKILSILTILC